jgi:hypothetical protein
LEAEPVFAAEAMGRLTTPPPRMVQGANLYSWPREPAAYES